LVNLSIFVQFIDPSRFFRDAVALLDVIHEHM